MKVRIEVIADDGVVFHGEAVLRKAKRKAHPSKKDVQARALRCPDAVRQIWQQGAFKAPLSFASIKAALSGDGYHFPDNTLMMALTNTTFLTKRGSKGSYEWAQRHPFNG
jgi:hypothetical protein